MDGLCGTVRDVQVRCALQRLGALSLPSAVYATQKQCRRLHGAGRGPGNSIKSRLTCVTGIRKAIRMWEAAALRHADLILSAFLLALPIGATSGQKSI